MFPSELNMSSDPRTLDSLGHKISGNTQTMGAHIVAPGELTKAFAMASFPRKFSFCFPTVGLAEEKEHQIWPLRGISEDKRHIYH